MDSQPGRVGPGQALITSAIMGRAVKKRSEFLRPGRTGQNVDRLGQGGSGNVGPCRLLRMSVVHKCVSGNRLFHHLLQLLATTLQNEKPELEVRKTELLKQEEDLKIQLAKLEESLLEVCVYLLTV